MRRTNIYLDEEQCSRLDELASHEGVSRAEVIRRFVDEGLHGAAPSLASDLSAIDDSFGGACDLGLPERESDDRQRELDAVLDA
jgi:hypothetical protein